MNRDQVRRFLEDLREAGSKWVLKFDNGDANVSERAAELLAALSSAPPTDERVRITDEMVERATMTLLGKERDYAPGIDWHCARDWTANRVRELMRKALHAALTSAPAPQSPDAAGGEGTERAPDGFEPEPMPLPRITPPPSAPPSLSSASTVEGASKLPTNSTPKPDAAGGECGCGNAECRGPSDNEHHQCGGPREACGVAGCRECAPPSSASETGRCPDCGDSLPHTYFRCFAVLKKDLSVAHTNLAAENAARDPAESSLATRDAELAEVREEREQWRGVAIDRGSEIASLRARLEEAEREKDKAVEAEQVRWQETIHGLDFVEDEDASGNESGDPLDFTADCIRAALQKLEARADAAEKERDEARTERDRWRDQTERAVGDATAAEARAKKAEQERDEANEAVKGITASCAANAGIVGSLQRQLAETKRAAEARSAELARRVKEMEKVAPPLRLKAFEVIGRLEAQRDDANRRLEGATAYVREEMVTGRGTIDALLAILTPAGTENSSNHGGSTR